jgi:hypothetical protein
LAPAADDAGLWLRLLLLLSLAGFLQALLLQAAPKLFRLWRCSCMTWLQQCARGDLLDTAVSASCLLVLHAQHSSTAQHSTAQHSTAQCSTAQQGFDQAHKP